MRRNPLPNFGVFNGGLAGPRVTLPRTNIPGVWTPDDFRQAGHSLADPYFSSVIALFHFSSPPPGSATIWLNEINPATFVLYPYDGVGVLTSPVKFEPTSMDCSNTSVIPYLAANRGAGEATWGPGAGGDFTIDGWIYPVAVNGTFNILDMRNSAPAGQPLIYISATGVLNYYTASANRIASAGSTVSAGAWGFFEYSRAAGTGRLFWNGTSVGSWADSTNYTSPGALYINSQFATLNSVAVNGGRNVWDSLRITQGVARNTANYTPPAVAFPSF